MDINTKRTLNNHVAMPLFGFGTYTIKDPQPILWALESGYRLLDTATVYENEQVVGEAIQQSGVARDELFVTTKICPQDLDNPGSALKTSLSKLGLEYVDLWLIHWPETGKRVSAWKKMEALHTQGLCKAIGVSNFTIAHLKELLATASIVPAVNQVEYHVYLNQEELLAYCTRKGITMESYMSLTRGRAGFTDEHILEIAKRVNKSVPQVMLRWILQKGLVAIPKSAHKERIKENADIFDFELSAKDMKILDGLDKEKHYCSWDPTNID